MQSKTKTHILITGFLAFLILCSVGVLIAVWFHDEPTFMADGAVWNGSDFPLGVCVKPYESSAEATKEASKAGKAAVDTINDQLDFHALSFRGESDLDCVIFGTLGVPVEPGWVDSGGHAKWQQYVNCSFRTANPPPGLEVLIIEHELGHCLGLEHDQYEASVMFKSVKGMDPTDVKTESVMKFPPSISDDDKKAIRERYLKK